MLRHSTHAKLEFYVPFFYSQKKSCFLHRNGIYPALISFQLNLIKTRLKLKKIKADETPVIKDEICEATILIFEYTNTKCFT